MAGVTFMSVWSDDEIGRLKTGDSLTLNGYEFTLDAMETGVRDNYQFEKGTFDVFHKSGSIATLASERRFYPVRDMVTTEAGFRLSPGATVFASLSEGDADNGWIVRVYYHPLVIWIWIGAFMMAIAGFISLFDRRLRFGKSTS